MGSIRLGYSSAGPVVIPKELRETHMHVLGQSRMGKSYFLEHMIRQDILHGNGVCVIDPHGELYDNLVRWLTVTRAGHHRQVHLICPSADGWSVGFNPFCAGDIDPSVRVDFMIDACAKVWDGVSPEKTPRLSKCLGLVFYALAVNRLSILEARKLMSVVYKEERLRLTSNLPNSHRQQDWNEFNAYHDRQFVEFMESAHSRLIPFASKPRVQRLMGQTENVIDFKKCMDRGDIVLVSLAGKGKLSESDGRLIGAMLVADMFFSAKIRDVKKAKAKPFYCYVDECADYLTTDIAKALDQTAKFGLHFILAHHRMSQLLKYGEDFADTIMAGAQTKAVFRIDADNAAEELARHLFRREFDIESRKKNLTMPVAVGQELVWLNQESSSRSKSVSEATGEGGGRQSSTNRSSGESKFIPDEGDAAGRTLSESAGSADGSTSSWSTATSVTEAHSETSGRSETFKTIYEERGIPYALDELIHEAIVRIRSLPRRECLLYLSGQSKTIRMKTETIEGNPVLPSMLNKAVGTFVLTSDFTSRDEEIAESIHARGIPVVLDEPDDDEDQFRIRAE